MILFLFIINILLLQKLLKKEFVVKIIYVLFICYTFFYLNIKYLNIEKKKNIEINEIIDENFFVIDSNNVEKVESHMYGYSVSEKGILTDNYFKQENIYQEPDPLGAYVIIIKKGKEIRIYQDFHGSMGIYIYENKESGYFAISNSFLLLEQYLVGKENISFNKDFSDNFIISSWISYSIKETMINEIIQIPSNGYVIINNNKKLKIFYKDYKENSIPLESEEGLKLIDRWMNKWGYIIRSIKKKTHNFSFDLSGGFDTRLLLTILLNSGINISDILINSSRDKLHGHDEDLEIATNISSKYNFKLNNKNLDKKSISLNEKVSVFLTIYSKLGFHKQFYLKDRYFLNPRFSFTGSGGEMLRGAPCLPIEKFIKAISHNNVYGHEEEFYNSSLKFLLRNIELLKKEKKIYNDYEISFELYKMIVGRYHFGKGDLESYLSNIYTLEPLMDPDIKKIKYNIQGNNPHDLISYIYIHFAYNLIYFPFQGNRSINLESIQRAEKLNNKYKPYEKSNDYNENFFMDFQRKAPNIEVKKNKDAYEYLREIFYSNKYYKIVKEIYDDKVYYWSKAYAKNNDFQPLTHEYGLLSSVLVKEILSVKEKCLKISYKKNCFEETKNRINYLFK